MFSNVSASLDQRMVYCGSKNGLLFSRRSLIKSSFALAPAASARNTTVSMFGGAGALDVMLYRCLVSSIANGSVKFCTACNVLSTSCSFLFIHDGLTSLCI